MRLLVRRSSEDILLVNRVSKLLLGPQFEPGGGHTVTAYPNASKTSSKLANSNAYPLFDSK